MAGAQSTKEGVGLGRLHSRRQLSSILKKKEVSQQWEEGWEEGGPGGNTAGPWGPACSKRQFFKESYSRTSFHEMETILHALCSKIQ